ncbi:MAG TPA: thioredoxin domain-containing protein [Longimicrobiales bacterium]|nr:thioredoxin domain-containing protein [Longimicrobiales bacterium]
MAHPLARSLVTFRGLAGLCAVALVAGGCGETDTPAPGDGTASLGADLLRSREEGTLSDPEAPDARMSTAPAPPPSLAAPTADIPIGELGYTAGDSAAPVRVVEFSDFGCGYCRQFHTETFPTLEEEYIATGKVQWKYVPMVLGMFGPNAEVAARAGECALEQGRFPAMRDRLFQEQPRWKRASDPMPVLADLAEDAGLEVERWRTCVEEDRRHDRIAAGTASAFRAGVRGTPTFFVVGFAPIPGALPLDVFRQVLDTVYAQASTR